MGNFLVQFRVTFNAEGTSNLTMNLSALQVCVVVGVLLFFLYMYYYMDHLHFHVLNAYANVGVSHAQHHVAHKYLNGENHKIEFAQ